MFAITNIDDIVILTTPFGNTRHHDRLRTRNVVFGQYLGLSAVVAIAATAAVGLLAVDSRWVGILGLVPIALGARGLWRARGRDTNSTPLLLVRGQPGRHRQAHD